MLGLKLNHVSKRGHRSHTVTIKICFDDDRHASKCTYRYTENTLAKIIWCVIGWLYWNIKSTFGLLPPTNRVFAVTYMCLPLCTTNKSCFRCYIYVPTSMHHQQIVFSLLHICAYLYAPPTNRVFAVTYMCLPLCTTNKSCFRCYIYVPTSMHHQQIVFSLLHICAYLYAPPTNRVFAVTYMCLPLCTTNKSCFRCYIYVPTSMHHQQIVFSLLHICAYLYAPPTNRVFAVTYMCLPLCTTNKSCFRCYIYVPTSMHHQQIVFSLLHICAYLYAPPTNRVFAVTYMCLPLCTRNTIHHDSHNSGNHLEYSAFHLHGIW